MVFFVPLVPNHRKYLALDLRRPLHCVFCVASGRFKRANRLDSAAAIGSGVAHPLPRDGVTWLTKFWYANTVQNARLACSATALEASDDSVLLITPGVFFIGSRCGESAYSNANDTVGVVGHRSIWRRSRRGINNGTGRQEFVLRSSQDLNRTSKGS